MSQTYGMESPGRHVGHPQRPPVRYVVVIDADGLVIAKLLLETRQQVEEIFASASEVAQLTQGLRPAKGADGPEWDDALQGYSLAQRRAADVYTLRV